MLVIQKSWWRNRWHVYLPGHTEGEFTWLASFKFEVDAWKYVNNYC